MEDLADTLAAIAEEVIATGNNGKVTATFAVSKGGDIAVIIQEEIKRSPPVKDARGAYFFAMDGQLHRDDPRQVRMEFRTVDKTTGEVISVTDGAATTREVS